MTGTQLRAWRLARHISQKDAALLLCTSQSSIAAWEKSTTIPAYAARLLALSEECDRLRQGRAENALAALRRLQEIQHHG